MDATKKKSPIDLMPFDEEKFRTKCFGLLVDSELLITPYTHAEQEMLKIVRGTSHNSQVAEEDIKSLKFNYYGFPFLVGGAFGAIATFCIWKLDKAVVKHNAQKEYAESAANKGPTANTNAKAADNPL